MPPIIVFDNVNGADDATASGSITPSTGIYGTKAFILSANPSRLALFEDSPPSLDGVMSVPGNTKGYPSVIYVHANTISLKRFHPVSGIHSGNVLQACTWMPTLKVFTVPQAVDISQGDTVQLNTGSPLITYVTAIVIQAGLKNCTVAYGGIGGADQSITVWRPPQIVIFESLGISGYFSWAIGGKRRTISETQSQKIFSNALPGWTIRLLNHGVSYTGGVSVTSSGSYDGLIAATQRGSILIEGKNGTSRGRVEVYTTTSITPLTIGLDSKLLVFKKLKFRHSGIGSVPALKNVSKYGSFIFDDCEFTSTVPGNTSSGVYWSPSADGPQDNDMRMQFRRCFFHDCESDAFLRPMVVNDAQTYTLQFIGCFLENNKGLGVSISRTRDVLVQWCIFAGNRGSIRLFGDATGDCGGARIIANTIDGKFQTGIGIEIADAQSMNGLVIVNNIICRHTGYGISGVNAARGLYIVDYNCLPSSAEWKNNGGHYMNLPAGDNDVHIDPGFNDTEGDDYGLGSKALAGLAYPKWPNGIGMTKTKSFASIGAAQVRNDKAVLEQDQFMR